MPILAYSPLLQNAIDSIHNGVEDLEAGTSSRSISALRSVHAGLLLLIKEVLVRMSPAGSNEVLIKEQIIPVQKPDGTIDFIGAGDKTVNVATLRARCKSLGLSIDWDIIQEISRSRNAAEHHSTSLNPIQIQTQLAKSYRIIQQVLVDLLDEDPVEALGAIWPILLKNNTVFEKERLRVVTELADVVWSSPSLHKALLQFGCPDCSAELLGTNMTKPASQDLVLTCRSCGADHDVWKIGGKAIEESFAVENHFEIKDGGDALSIDCPFCGESAYVVSEGKCALCEESAAEDCALCGNSIPVCEINDGQYCGYCDHKLEKTRSD